jgi:hypothetical protein
MAAKYTRQGAETPLTEDGEKASSHRTIIGPGGTAMGIRKGSTLGPPGEHKFTAANADPGQLQGLERDIDRLKAELAAVVGHDQRTGEPIFQYTGELRRARELQLAHLEKVELPAVQQLVAQAQAWRTENVESPLQALSREHREREARHARALELADEIEAQAEAERIARRRVGLGIK